MAAKERSSDLTPEARHLCLSCVAIPSHLLLPLPARGSLALVPLPRDLCPRSGYVLSLSESADCPSCVGSLTGLWQTPAALSDRHHSR